MYARSVNYRSYYGHVRNFGQYLYLIVFIKQWNCPTFSFCWIDVVAILLEYDFFWYNLEAENSCFFVEKSSKSSYICVFIGRSTFVGQRPMKSLTSVRMSVRLSLNFLKTGSLVFSDIVQDDTRPWYLVTDKARFLKKKIKLAAWIWVQGTYIRPKMRFFTIFSSLVHYFSFKLRRMIAWNNL